MSNDSVKSDHVIVFDPFLGKPIELTEDFVYCSEDVWKIWDYPSEIFLYTTALCALTRWTAHTGGKPSFCYYTVNNKITCYFTRDFGVMLIALGIELQGAFFNKKIKTADSLYFIQDRKTGNIKIGRSDNVDRRLKDLQCANSSELVLLKTLVGLGKLEKQIHRQFSDAKIRNEWFRPTQKILSYIATVDSSAK